MRSPKQWLLLSVCLSFCIGGQAFAGDSTSLSNTLPAANNGRGISTYYPDQATAPSISTGASGTSYYDNLPHCPGDPTIASAPPAPICPDINDVWTTSPTANVPAGTKVSASTTSIQALRTYCPDVCQTNRKVVTGTPITNGSTTYTPVTSMTPAICPAGYVQIGASTSGPDIQYDASVGTPIKVTTDIDYINYKNKGYTCGEVPNTVPKITSYCDYDSANVFVNTESNNCDSTKIGTPQYYIYAGSLAYGILKTCPTYTAANISANTVVCKAQGVSKCTVPQGTNSSGLCEQTHAVLFFNSYADIYCTPPAGYYYTTDTVPTKLACARVKSVWQKRY